MLNVVVVYRSLYLSLFFCNQISDGSVRVNISFSVLKQIDSDKTQSVNQFNGCVSNIGQISMTCREVQYPTKLLFTLQYSIRCCHLLQPNYTLSCHVLIIHVSYIYINIRSNTKEIHYYQM